jgi:prepilin-type N-terminal cleavage/methylation domain-containing protein
MQKGFSLAELMVVLGIAGVLLAVSAPRARGWRDGRAVRQAAFEVGSFYQAARHGAIMRATRVRIELGADSLRALYETATADSLFLVRSGPARRGVAVTVSRPVIRIEANGLGYGAANTKLVLRKGLAAESLTTSRLGRLKRW